MTHTPTDSATHTEAEPIVVSLSEFDGATEAIVRSEIEAQIIAARSYPRSIARFRQDLYAMVTVDKETADSCYYSLPRKERGKIKYLEGPSVRFAEFAKSAYGNVRSDGRIVDIGERFVKAQGLCWDMERNNGSRIEVLRRITNRDGRRYTDDMIGVTCNAAIAIAVRNAIFDTIPFALCKQAYDAALDVANDKSVSMADRRDMMLGEWRDIGVKPEIVLQVIGREGLDDVSAKDLRALRGILNAITSGETTVERLLRDEFADDRAHRFRQTLQKPDPNAIALLSSQLQQAYELGLVNDGDNFEQIIEKGTAADVADAVETLSERLANHG